MAIEPGQNLLHYRIVDRLGEGGMGVVWRARDTTLDREVAIKVLPDAFATDRDRLLRFEREAKLLASLNHPNIAAVYGMHETNTPGGSVRFIAMELVEGEDLAVRLARGPMTVEDALDVAIQVADGFAAAHDQGVIHRDLKPANVVCGAENKVKILDFGLAKAFAADGGSGVESLSKSPTITAAGTVAGTLLGTAAYMSPEQARGKSVDRRADVWAFGCLVFEMLTGRRAFGGETITDVLAGIVHKEPDWEALPAGTPVAARRLLERCLRKDVRSRVRDMGDLRVALEDARSGPALDEPASGAVPVVSPAPRRNRLWPALAGLLGLALIATLVVRFGPSNTSSPTPGPAAAQRYILTMANLQTSASPVLSPDGSFVVINEFTGDTSRLLRRDLGSFQTVPIPGTEDGRAPFFSPDGAWIGFSTLTAIKRVPSSGSGVAQVITEQPRVSSGDWGEDGMIYFTQREGGPDGFAALMRVPDSGGDPELFARLDTAAGEVESWLPEILPGGKVVLVSIIGGGSQKIVAFGVDGSRHTVVEDAFLSRYVAPGYLVYRDASSRAAVAAPFDPSTARITGAAIALTEEVDPSYCFDVAREGKLVYVPVAGAGEGNEIVWLDHSGAATPLTDERAEWVQPRISPDGKRVLLRKIASNCELWLLDVERGSLARIVQGPDAHDAIWGPDGRRFVYHQANIGTIVTQTISGARENRTLAKGTDAGSPSSWTARGDRIAYTRSGRSTGDDIWILEADGSTPPEPFLETSSNEDNPAFSPDGRWIAYSSDESGNPEIFVRAYPDEGRVWQVSIGGGQSPLWSRDGRELYFLAGSKMMSARVSTQPELKLGTPVELFDVALGASHYRNYDVAPDGRFVAVRQSGTERGQREVRILLGWQHELLRTSTVHQ